MSHVMCHVSLLTCHVYLFYIHILGNYLVEGLYSLGLLRLVSSQCRAIPATQVLSPPAPPAPPPGVVAVPSPLANASRHPLCDTLGS